MSECPFNGPRCWLAGRGWPADYECVNGVAINIDVYFEGWERDVVAPLAPCHPGFCERCNGTGEISASLIADDVAPEEIDPWHAYFGDCPVCNGEGNVLGPNDSLERLLASIKPRPLWERIGETLSGIATGAYLRTKYAWNRRRD